MDTVIFACVHNAGRSQMATAFFNQLADPGAARAVSAGTQPGERVHPVVVDVMKEVGLDLTQNRPQKLTEELARGASLLITMGCGDECPYVPGLARDDIAGRIASRCTKGSCSRSSRSSPQARAASDSRRTAGPMPRSPAA